MRNLRMAEKLAAGAALDVEKIGTPDPDFAGVYQLRSFTDGIDYFVGSTEQWIWSVGRRKVDGVVFASIDSRFYQNPAFECLWLR